MICQEKHKKKSAKKIYEMFTIWGSPYKTWVMMAHVFFRVFYHLKCVIGSDKILDNAHDIGVDYFK